jgi:AcrR family transcriptional regulator
VSSEPNLLELITSAVEAFAVSAETDPTKARTRARILRAATALFQRQGYRRTSIDEVARDAGVAKGTVYLYFRNKAELLIRAVAEEKRAYVTKLLPILAGDLAPADRLRALLELGLVMSVETPLISKLLSGDREVLLSFTEAGPDLRDQLQRMQQMLLGGLVKGVGAFDRLDPAEQHARLQGLLGLMWTSVHLMDERVRGGMDVKSYARVVAKMIVEGIGAP